MARIPPSKERPPRVEPSGSRRSRPRVSPPAAHLCSATPGLRRHPLSPAARSHSLFLRKRSSCSTAMALTQSRAACSSEYNVKAMASRSRPEAQLIFLPPPQGTWRRHGRSSPTGAGEAPNALSRKLRPDLPRTRPLRQRGACGRLSGPPQSRVGARYAWLLKARNVAGRS